jgi:hypothetical protein|nr:MAG TPA: hypothetical protein [Caudoviricetes sp.]
MKKFLDINDDNIHCIEDFCSTASKVTPPRNVGVMGGSYTRQVSTSTASLTSHSCLATNKQILLKDEIKQIKLRIEDNGYR